MPGILEEFPTKEFDIETLKYTPPVLISVQEQEEYKASLQNLADSIKTNGLLHSIVVKNDGSIVAGRKRLEAIKIAYPEIKKVHCRVVPDNLTKAEYRMFSIHENLKRDNLGWAEQILLEKELHDLRQLQHGVPGRGRYAAPGWTVEDTGKELGISFGYISEDLRIADAIMADPSLRNIKDKTTARRVILTKLKRQSQEDGAGVNFDETVKDAIYQGDATRVLQTMAPNIFDACITDPPWMVFKDDKYIKDNDTELVFPEVFRVLKANAFLIMFVGVQDWIRYSELLPKLGFKIQGYPSIWAKQKSLSYGTASWQFQRDYEFIMVAVKGSPALTKNAISSVITQDVVPAAKLQHPNEKPIDLIERILDYCTFENSLVLDPFCGSGTVGAACKNSRRNYVLIERDSTHFFKAKERLKKI